MTKNTMEAKIEAKEAKLEFLFSKNFMFNIPIYQRNFSWDINDFDSLFEDISIAMDNNQEQYFLGSILLQEIDEKVYDVVDGQQRLTALTILFAVVRDSVEDKEIREEINTHIYQKTKKLTNNPARMRVTPWKDLQDLFKKYIYSLNGTRNFIEDFDAKLIKYRDTEDPVYHIYEAIKIYNSKVNELENPENIISYILNNVFMVYIKTDSFTSAFRLFNVLNARGKPLTTYDLLKSENLGELDTSTQEKYAKILRSLENNLGMKELEKVIGYMRTIITKERAKSNIYEEYKRIFKENLLKRGTEFLDYLKKIADIYQDKILDGEIKANDEKMNRYKITVNIMNRFIPFSDWIPPLIAFHEKIHENHKSEELALDFLLKLEKKVVLEWMAGFSFTERITSLNKVVKCINETSDPHTIINELLHVNPAKKGKKSRILNFDDEKEVKSILEEKLDDDHFYSLYGGKLAKYLLLRIDMELWDLSTFPGYHGLITVEHVLPQNPDKDGEWCFWFNDEERQKWTNRLGNLVLLSGRKNSKASNYRYMTKKTIYFSRKRTPFQITQETMKYTTWDMDTLKNRHSELKKRAKEIYCPPPN